MKDNFQALTSLCFDCGSKMNYVPPNQLVDTFDQIFYLAKQKKVTNKVIHNESIIIHTKVHKVADITW